MIQILAQPGRFDFELVLQATERRIDVRRFGERRPHGSSHLIQSVKCLGVEVKYHSNAFGIASTDGSRGTKPARSMRASGNGKVVARHHKRLRPKMRRLFARLADTDVIRSSRASQARGRSGRESCGYTES